MRVLVACEFSGIVREAFRAKGHDAWSCDLLPTEIPGNHIQDDVLKHLNEGWDMMIAFPPCTHLASSGARWFKYKKKEQQEAISFVIALLYFTDIPKICIENPIGVLSSQMRKPDQIIQPYHFGDPYQKTTCLWLINLPKLIPTHFDAPLWGQKLNKGEFMITKSGKRFAKWYNIPPGPERAKLRSKTFLGIANAMAEQWG